MEPGHISAHSGYHYPHLPWLSQNRACNYYIALNDVCSFILTSRPLFPQLGGHRIVVSVGLIRKLPIYTRMFPQELTERSFRFPGSGTSRCSIGSAWMNNLPRFCSFLFPSSRHLRRINTERLILDRESFTSWLGSKVVSKDNLRTNIAKFLGRSVLVDGEGHVSKTSMKSKGGRIDSPAGDIKTRGRALVHRSWTGVRSITRRILSRGLPVSTVLVPRTL